VKTLHTTLLLLALAPPAAALAQADLPQKLSQTGLYVDGRVGELRRDLVTFAPQYPLWTDGATKRRWMYLPPGTWIDARQPDAWRFPVGTRFWKEFSFAGRPIETRTLERTTTGWRFATYVWNADGTDAELAPDRGTLAAAEIGPGVRHRIPSRGDCRACHDGPETPVLGFSALQLSPDRDPRAPHAETLPNNAVNLDALVTRRLVRGLPRLAHQPRIQARNETERAALGYLHGNCASCHNGRGPLAALGLRFDQPASGNPATVLASLVGQPSVFRAPDSPATVRVQPAAPARSTLVYRVRSHSPLARMPPLGTAVVDQTAVRLLEDWISHMNDKENER
jgi:hypothetical protein